MQGAIVFSTTVFEGFTEVLDSYVTNPINVRFKTVSSVLPQTVFVFKLAAKASLFVTSSWKVLQYFRLAV